MSPAVLGAELIGLGTLVNPLFPSDGHVAIFDAYDADGIKVDHCWLIGCENTLAYGAAINPGPCKWGGILICPPVIPGPLVTCDPLPASAAYAAELREPTVPKVTELVVIGALLALLIVGSENEGADV